MKSKKKKGKKKELSKFITLVEVTIVINDNPLFEILDNICFLSKNVYNSALYQYRQAFFADNNKCLKYEEIDKMFKTEKNVDYYALPVKVSQHSIKLAVNEFKSFFENLRSKKKDNDSRTVHIPGYLNSTTGRQTAFYSNQAVHTTKLKSEGYYTLTALTDSSGELIRFYTKVTNIQFVRISHRGNHIRVEVGYRTFKKHPKVTENIAAIDLGVNNIVALTTNFDKPIIFNGKHLKYINHQYNKLIAKNQSSNSNCNNISDNEWTEHMRLINLTRSNRITDYLHKVSRTIVNYLVSNHVSILIVGKNDGWKQNTNMGAKGNQNFVQIPFNRLIQMLTYKCAEKGISVVTICESHTSKCSFIDNEPIHHQDKYAGKRINRELFKTSKGLCINADVNGSYNIMKRWCLTNKVEHFLRFNKYWVCQNPTKIIIRLNGIKCDVGEYINQIAM